MHTYTRSAQAKDLRDAGRIILAWGEVTGHHHEVVERPHDNTIDSDIPAAQFFEEPDGRRILLVARPCLLQHQEHGAIALDPGNPVQVRQGDVLLQPLGPGAWEVIRQREYSPSETRNVAD